MRAGEGGQVGAPGEAHLSSGHQKESTPAWVLGEVVGPTTTHRQVVLSLLSEMGVVSIKYIFTQI